MNQVRPITAKGYKQLEEELAKLITVEREKIKTTLQEARALGDLKENAEYHSAKERQALNEGKIAQLQSALVQAKVVDTSSITSEKIVFWGHGSSL